MKEQKQEEIRRKEEADDREDEAEAAYDELKSYKDILGLLKPGNQLIKLLSLTLFCKIGLLPAAIGQRLTFSSFPHYKVFRRKNISGLARFKPGSSRLSHSDLVKTNIERGSVNIR